MSVQFDTSRQRWVVRWREGGRQRTRRFVSEQAARSLEGEHQAAKAAARRAGRAETAGELAHLRARVDLLERRLPEDARTSGVSAYPTRQGVRWRISVPRADATVSTRRGYETHAAACRARDRLAAPTAVGPELSFACFWRAWLAGKRPYVTDGALEDLETHGRTRLLPHLAHLPVGDITDEHVHSWLTRMIAQHEAGGISAKTVNNARAALSGALGDAARRGLLPENPCRHVAPLPIEQHELDYLRLAEIGPYLRACPVHYRPLAALLIGTGARISEALALTWPDIDLDHGTVTIQRQRARHGHSTRQPKGKRSRRVLIGPHLTAALHELDTTERRAAHAPDWVFICPRPLRGRYAHRLARHPPSRRTAHEWHHQTLAAAGLRPMPLHALRHTAAASWLTTGHSLIFVARQLGHRSITTTEQHYGHLELNLFTAGLQQTDEAITRAGRPRAER